MASKITLPDGRVITHRRTYAYAIVCGPCDPEKFVRELRSSEQDLQRQVDAMDIAIHRAVVEKDGTDAWLSGWEYTRIEHFGADLLMTYFYIPGDVETEPYRRSGSLLEILLNHVAAERLRTSLRMYAVSVMADQIEAGETSALGIWDVVRWCRNREVAERAFQEYAQDRDRYGGKVLLQENEVES